MLVTWFVFASEARQIQDKVIAGKAMDDRTGCYVMIEADEKEFMEMLKMIFIL